MLPLFPGFKLYSELNVLMKVSDQKCFTAIFTFFKPNLSKVTTRMTVPLETTEKVLTNSGNREG